MQKDYFEIGGEDYRLEWNWNAISNFIDATGRTLGDIDKIGMMKPKDITLFIHAAFVEGCRLDGWEFPHTAETLAGELELSDITAILGIYSQQIASRVSTGKAKKK